VKINEEIKCQITVTLVKDNKNLSLSIYFGHPSVPVQEFNLNTTNNRFITLIASYNVSGTFFITGRLVNQDFEVKYTVKVYKPVTISNVKTLSY
jgi:hypothetical protein